MKPENPHYGDTARKNWQEGYTAGVNDRKAWEQESCTEHPLINIPNWNTRYPSHRFQCPFCMEVE